MPATPQPSSDYTGPVRPAEVIAPSADHIQARLTLARLLRHPGFDGLSRRPHHIGGGVFMWEWVIRLTVNGELSSFFGPSLVDVLSRVKPVLGDAQRTGVL